MILTEVWVPGHPRTKGSLSAKGSYVSDTPASKRWRALMAETVRQDVTLRGAHPDVYPYAGPVAVWCVAWLQRPGSAVSAEPAIWHNAGDVDKLARNVLDAIAADAKSSIMNGGVIMNDNQVIRLSIEKFAAHQPDRSPGMYLCVLALTGTSWAPDGRHWLATVERVRKGRTSVLDNQVLKS